MTSKGMLVRELMTPETVSVSMDHTLLQVKQIFVQKRFHHLVVIDAGKVVGVISDRDLLKNVSPFIGVRLSERRQDVDTLKKRVHQIMTRKLISVDPGAPAADAARLMMRHRVSCIPVIDAAGKLVGIVTTKDMVRWAVLQEQRSQPEE